MWIKTCLMHRYENTLPGDWRLVWKRLITLGRKYTQDGMFGQHRCRLGGIWDDERRLEAKHFPFLSVECDKVVPGGEGTSECSVFVSGCRCLLMSLAVISVQKVKVAPRSRSLVCLSGGGDVGDVFRTLKDHRRHLLSVLLLTAAVKSSTTLSLSAFELSVFIIVLLCTIINHAVGQFTPWTQFTAPANRPTVSNDLPVPRKRFSI